MSAQTIGGSGVAAAPIGAPGLGLGAHPRPSRRSVLGRQRRPALEAEAAAQPGRDPARRQRVLDGQRARARHRIDERQVERDAAQRQHGRAPASPSAAPRPSRRGSRAGAAPRPPGPGTARAPGRRDVQDDADVGRLGVDVGPARRARRAATSTTASFTFSAAKPECVSAGVSRTLPWTASVLFVGQPVAPGDGARTGVQRRRVGRVELGRAASARAPRRARAGRPPCPSSAAPRTRRRPVALGARDAQAAQLAAQGPPRCRARR